MMSDDFRTEINLFTKNSALSGPLPVLPAPIEVHRGLCCIGAVHFRQNVEPAGEIAVGAKVHRENKRPGSVR